MFLGLDFSERFVAVILADGNGHALVALRAELPRIGNSSARWLAAMDIAHQALLQNHTIASQIETACIAFFAPLDLDGVVVKDARAASWNDYDLKRALQEHLKIENALAVPRVLAEAIAEERHGALRAPDISHGGNWLYLHLGATLEASARAGGVLVRGAQGAALELGAICLERHGELSDNGRRGSLEAYCGGDAFITRARSYSLGMSTPAEIWGMTATNFMAKSLCDDYTERLAQGVGGALAILNPSRVVIGGELGHEIGAMILEPLRARLGEYCLPRHYEGLEIEVGQLGRDAGVLGAVSIARDGLK